MKFYMLVRLIRLYTSTQQEHHSRLFCTVADLQLMLHDSATCPARHRDNPIFLLLRASSNNDLPGFAGVEAQLVDLRTLNQQTMQCPTDAQPRACSGTAVPGWNFCYPTCCDWCGGSLFLVVLGSHSNPSTIVCGSFSGCCAHWWPSTGTQEVGTQPCSEEHNLSSTYPAGPCPTWTHHPTCGAPAIKFGHNREKHKFSSMMTPVYFESIILFAFPKCLFHLLVPWYHPVP